MNPYDFVSIPNNSTCQRANPNSHAHHRLHHQAMHGRIYCSLKTLTPLFIPRGDQQFVRDTHKRMEFFGTTGLNTQVRGTPIIPGTSLKGVLRSTAEAAANTCLSKSSARHFPQVFAACVARENLCMTCRVFGMLNRQSVMKGKISISDAESINFSMMGSKTLKILQNPKDRHSAFYRPGGRKFYFHHQNMEDLTHWTTQKTDKFNTTVNPVAPGSHFTFTVDFHNLTPEEYSLLIYSLVLEDTMRHKVGYAKPLGLGSVHITISRINTYNPMNRYSSRGDHQDFQGNALQEHLDQHTAVYRNNSEINLQDLREIWRWDPNSTTIYRYPTQDWFKNNSQANICQTP